MKKYHAASLIEEVILIAGIAAEAVMQVYEGADFGVESKSDDSPLTKADRASNAVLCEMLSKLTPGCPIISEENDILPYRERKNFEQYWLLDPLDGTKEFIKKNDEFAINIAFMEGDRPIMGVVHLPAKREVYFACRGGGAWKMVDGKAVQLQAATFSMDQPELVIAVSLSHSNKETTDYLLQFKNPHVVAKGSALKIMMIAEGKVHLHPRFGGTMEWDTAAPQIILEEAGGEVRMLDGKPLSYNKENLKNPDYVVYGRLV